MTRQDNWPPPTSRAWIRAIVACHRRGEHRWIDGGHADVCGDCGQGRR